MDDIEQEIDLDQITDESLLQSLVSWILLWTLSPHQLFMFCFVLP